MMNLKTTDYDKDFSDFTKYPVSGIGKEKHLFMGEDGHSINGNARVTSNAVDGKPLFGFRYYKLPKSVISPRDIRTDEDILHNIVYPKVESGFNDILRHCINPDNPIVGFFPEGSCPTIGNITEYTNGDSRIYDSVKKAIDVCLLNKICTHPLTVSMIKNGTFIMGYVLPKIGRKINNLPINKDLAHVVFRLKHRRLITELGHICGHGIDAAISQLTGIRVFSAANGYAINLPFTAFPGDEEYNHDLSCEEAKRIKNNWNLELISVIDYLEKHPLDFKYRREPIGDQELRRFKMKFYRKLSVSPSHPVDFLAYHHAKRLSESGMDWKEIEIRCARFIKWYDRKFGARYID